MPGGGGDESRRERRRDCALCLLMVAVALVVITPRVNPKPHAVADGLGHFSYLPALFAGRPFDLDELAAPEAHAMLRNYPATGRTINFWPIGPAMAWLPWYAAGRALYPDAPLTDRKLWAACAVGTVAITLAGLVFLFLALRAALPRWAAFVAALSALLATPLLAYATASPYFSHHLSFALASVLLWLVMTRDLRRGWRPWLAAGAVCGWLVATRLQEALFALLPLVAIWPRRPRLGQAAAFGSAFTVLFAPQMLLWKMTYDRWLVLVQTTPPHGQYVGSPHIWQVLFSPLHGLLLWHPLLLVGVVGLVTALWKPNLRPLAAAGLLLFVAQTVINATVWLGDDKANASAFGGRRFCDLVPLLSLGFGLLAARAPRALTAAAAVAAYWNLGLLWAWTAPMPVPPSRVLHPAYPLTVPIARRIAAQLLPTWGQVIQVLLWLSFVALVFIAVVGVLYLMRRGAAPRAPS